MGQILGSVELVDCKSTTGRRGKQGTGRKYADWVHELSERERAFGDFTPGRYGWFCEEPRELPEPIPARGYPGLWTWEGEVSL